MESQAKQYVESFMSELISKNPGEKEFHQAVREVVESVAPYIVENPQLIKMKIMERIAEPERVVMFRVPWLNDRGEVEINKGFFAYSCLAQIDDDTIGVLYESQPSSYIEFKTFFVCVS